MLSFEEYKAMFENITEELFKDCIFEEKNTYYQEDRNYISCVLRLKGDIHKLLEENDEYYQITDIISHNIFMSTIKSVYYDEINKFEYLEDVWSGYKTTRKCYDMVEGNVTSLRDILENKLEELKAQFMENLNATYDKYVKSYEIKKEYIDFAKNIKRTGFDVCDYQNRGELRVPCTFKKDINNIELYVRKNISNYRIYMKCKIGGRYGMTVEEFEESYEILKRESDNIKNALIGENII